MKKFEIPSMKVQKLDSADIMTTSCFEIFACEDCYCTSVTCEGTYVCDGLKCSILDSI